MTALHFGTQCENCPGLPGYEGMVAVLKFGIPAGTLVIIYHAMQMTREEGPLHKQKQSKTQTLARIMES
jgi:hypothetical protein